MTGQRPRIRDVAERAGVAVSTVSNVLNSPHKVRVTTRTRVEGAIAELGFVRNSSAQALRSGSTDLVGLILSSIGTPFAAELARAVRLAAGRVGLKLVIASSDGDAAAQADYLQTFQRQQMAGLIVAAAAGSPMADTGGTEPPVVWLNRHDGSACSVVRDDERAGYLAARHLLSRGATRLGLLPDGLDRPELIYDGLARAATRAGMAAPANLSASRFRSSGVDGVVAGSHEAARTVLGDIDQKSPFAVVVVDQNRGCADHRVSVPTVSAPAAEVGRLAVELLVEKINSPVHHHRVVTVEPVLRKPVSTR